MGTASVVAVIAIAALAALVGWLLGRSSAANQATSELAAARQAAATERARADAQAAAAEQRIADLRIERTRLRDEFASLSADVLRQTSADFMVSAEQRMTREHERAVHELATRERAVAHLVEPITASLTKVETQLAEVERSRNVAYTELRTQVEQMGQLSANLREETGRLVGALRAPNVRGRWGEMQLRRTVEAAGMVEHCDFVEQDHRAGVDGAQRPDLVVRLAGDRVIVVDSKVPLQSWLDAHEATDEHSTQQHLRKHAKAVRVHVDALADKQYWTSVETTPEFVLLFLPADAFLDSALKHDAGLLEHAFSRNVILATPTTLVTLLRTVGYTWRQESLAKNAAQVLALGAELHVRLSTMGTHVSKLGGSLTKAVTSYNEAVGCLESRVMVTARKFTDLRVSSEELALLPQVEVGLRAVGAVELTTTVEQADAESAPRDVADHTVTKLPPPNYDKLAGPSGNAGHAVQSGQVELQRVVGT